MTRINIEQPVVHDLKIERSYLREVLSGRKRFEVRKDDRDFCDNDFLMLRSYDQRTETYNYSWALVQITDVFGRYEGESEFVAPGYVILAIKKIEGMWNIDHD